MLCESQLLYPIPRIGTPASKTQVFVCVRPIMHSIVHPNPCCRLIWVCWIHGDGWFPFGFYFYPLVSTLRTLCTLRKFGSFLLYFSPRFEFSSSFWPVTWTQNTVTRMRVRHVATIRPCLWCSCVTGDRSNYIDAGVGRESPTQGFQYLRE